MIDDKNNFLKSLHMRLQSVFMRVDYTKNSGLKNTKCILNAFLHSEQFLLKRKK